MEHNKLCLRPRVAGPAIIACISALLFANNCVGCLGCRSDPPTVSPTAVDTTSHALRIEIDSLSGPVPVVFNDVAIISQADVWAVGELGSRDSMPPARGYFGAAHWNGTSWSLQQLPVRGSFGDTVWATPDAIFAFGPHDIWLVYGGIHRFDGTHITQSWWLNNPDSAGNQLVYMDRGEGILTLWGSSPSDIYAVGPGGVILHYDGVRWVRLETGGVTLAFTDVYGVRDPLTGAQEVYAVGGQDAHIPHIVVRLEGEHVRFIRDTVITYSLRGTWFSPGKQYYVVGDGIYHAATVADTTLWLGGDLSESRYFSFAIRGSAQNDVFVVGSSGEIVHFNGKTWHSYIDRTAIDGSLMRVAVTKDMVVAVGSTSWTGIVIRGYRIPQ